MLQNEDIGRSFVIKRTYILINGSYRIGSEMEKHLYFLRPYAVEKDMGDDYVLRLPLLLPPAGP